MKDIEGFGDKTFEQSAGFLRIKGADNPLDRTAVHPESYPLVERMATSLGITINDLIENSEKVNAIEFKTFENEAGRYTVADIRMELLNPGRDPRNAFVVPKFREDVKEIGDLKEGMELEGSVTNVTNFGAFVDLGVHQDGLVHISELSHRFVQDARQAVKVGDIVKVKVIGVDSTMKRISLSMKALQPKPPRPPRHKRTRPAPIQATPAADATAVQPFKDGESQAPALPRRDQRPRPQKGQRPPRLERKREEVRVEAKEGRIDPPPRPAKETVAPPPPQSMEEKIRLLKEKFSSAR